MLRSSIITYDGLPVSSGGAHRLRTHSPKVALKQVRGFLESCTDALGPLNAFIEVMAGRSFPDEFSIPLIERLTTKLGTPLRRHAGTKNIVHRWTLAADQIDEYVARIEQACPLPIDPFGIEPFVVAAVFNFRIVNRDTRVAFLGQEVESYGGFSPYPGQLLGQSQLYARISERPTVSLFLNFPFEASSEDLLAAVAYVQANLPFVLSPNHWKLWRLTKKGTSYSGRKINIKV